MTLGDALVNLGALRSLTDAFVTFRNSAMQNKRIFYDNGPVESEDHMALIPLHDDAAEGESSSYVHCVASGQPGWLHFVDEIQYEVSKIRKQMAKLKVLQEKHASGLSFRDEISQEEQEINNCTTDVTKSLNHANQLLRYITKPDVATDPLRMNVVTAIVQMLQELSAEFQKSQGNYMRKIHLREVSYQDYFDTIGGGLGASDNIFNDDLFVEDLVDVKSGEITLQALHKLEENAAFVKERQEEIMHVSKSIMDVNQLFQDLATFVVDQGAVLDRIDCNVEFSAVKTRSALGSIKSAEKYQRRSRKSILIIVLIVSCVVLMLLIVVFKT